MSVEAMVWALKKAPGVPSQCVGVLMGLADAADKHGRGAYPSAITLCRFARKSERQVRADIALLTEAEVIRLGDQSLTHRLPVNRRPVVYDLAMERVADLQSTAPHGKRRGGRRSGVQSTSGVQPTAPLQPTAPQEADDLRKQDGVQPTAPQVSDLLGCSPASPGVQPAAYNPTDNPKTEKTSRSRRDLNAGREDVERLCTHLADRIQANDPDGKRPAIGAQWRDAARLMLDADHRQEDQVHRAIDWCQTSEFWRKNIRSMPTLRDQYARLRMEAEDERKRTANGHGPKPARPLNPDRPEHMARR